MRILVISDMHYAGAVEKARRGWEARVIRQPWLRGLASMYRRYLWLADPTAHNHQVEAFIERAGEADLVVANGDYSCDSAFVGVSDDGAFASAEECLAKLRRAFGERLLATIGDHELGKMSLFGGAGGLRLSSWYRSIGELGLSPAWASDLGNYVLIGVTSSLIALPVFEPELLPSERDEWEGLRRACLGTVRGIFERVGRDRRIILFCHDPTALPFLARESAVTARLPQLACTVIGHLHSESILRVGKLLAGMPELGFLGNTARRLSSALRRARAWAPFRVVLCPSLAGIQLLKDGGFLELDVSSSANELPGVRKHRLSWKA
jgi:hypothetical protein